MARYGGISCPSHIQITLLMLLISSFAITLMAMTTGDKDLAITSYNNAFYYEPADDPEVGFYLVDTNGSIPNSGHFWQTCEQIEVLEDAYERTQSATYSGMITKLIAGLNKVVSATDDWASWNGYNDDVMWGVIALVRAYEITQNSNLLSQAETQFEAVWSRAWDAAVGGLWWSTANVTKNACVNFPATIAAMCLAKLSNSGGDYRTRADQLWKWARANLYDNSTGRVIDHKYPNGTLAPDTWSFTYNQGTFIGAAYMLYQDTSTLDYLADCSLAATFTKDNLTGQHHVDILQDESGGADGPGFKGIFARWCGKYATGRNDPTIGPWLTKNADSAWQYRNSQGLMWEQWWQRTPDAYVTSWECSSGLAMSQDAP